MSYIYKENMKIFFPHITVFSGRTKKAPKPVQREFERAGKGDGLDLIIVRVLDWGKSFYAQRGNGLHVLNFLSETKKGTLGFLISFPKIWDRRRRGIC